MSGADRRGWVNTMRVLMFGWEFPPYQAGGLATATLGLVKGLLRTGVHVTLVVPFPIDGSVLPELRLVSTAGLPTPLRRVRVPSPLTAYGGVEDYTTRVAVRRIPGPRGVAPYGLDLARELQGRLARIFLRDAAGRRPCHGDDPRYATDPHWRELVLFNESFHGDSGRGVGASHQTGWTGLVTRSIEDLAQARVP